MFIVEYAGRFTVTKATAATWPQVVTECARFIDGSTPNVRDRARFLQTVLAFAGTDEPVLLPNGRTLNIAEGEQPDHY